jgi:hypothetical protein
VIVLLLDGVAEEEEDSVDDKELRELLLKSVAEELELLRVLVLKVLEVGAEEVLLLERLAELLVIVLLDSMPLLLLGEMVLLDSVLLLLLAEMVLLDSTELLLEVIALEKLLVVELLVSEAELLVRLLLLEVEVMPAELVGVGGRIPVNPSAEPSSQARKISAMLMARISNKLMDGVTRHTFVEEPP